MRLKDIKDGMILRGELFPEPVEVITTIAMDDSLKLIATGVESSKTYQPILSKDQIDSLIAAPTQRPFNGDPFKFRLGVEAIRLGLAYEYDPYFSLSIARVDPLPHQLEAVYDYFLKLPRIRFLLADDPGAGKTIMAGLLIKELKARGLVKRILIVTPANLSFQWQREMKDKFREQFSVVRGDVLRANYGSNPWQDFDQVVTSVSWVSRIEDAKDSLLRADWDLVIVDEAHKMSASNTEKKTLAYQLGEQLSELTDHYLLMTATPHKGDPAHFSLFLQLLDKDVYGDISSLEKAMEAQEAPFYLRRVKEALVTFPDGETGEIKRLFTKRHVKTLKFEINEDELELYDMLTQYVRDQSVKASLDGSATGRVIGFAMAMLQRRFASSVYALRRTLERMVAKRERILADPHGHRKELIERKLSKIEDFEEMEAEEQERLLVDIEDIVPDIDPEVLKFEIIELNKLVNHAKRLESVELETKLTHLRQLLKEEGIFEDSKMKILIFTEHKDTLDYLAGDGQEGKPLGKLREWGLSVTTIHGGMKIGDRDTPGTRIFAEREFKEDCQVLVATEAAGEGINLQFCWLMVNYDIPWNPVRLEQRMGRIHRYGQEKNCLIFNFVAINTTEGRVMDKLFERIEAIQDDLDPDRTGKIFNVLGDVFPSNLLEKMLRDMYAKNQMTEELILQRIVSNVDTDKLRQITESTLEGLAKRELNLSAIVGKSAEAKERRLVPEAIEDFFTEAAREVGLLSNPSGTKRKFYKIGKIPRPLLAIGQKQEPKFGRLGKSYGKIVFNKDLLTQDPSFEWVTPGHPLFESIRTSILNVSKEHLEKGAVFYDLRRDKPSRLDVFTASFRDGLGNVLKQGLFVAEATLEGEIKIQQPTIFLDIIPADSNPALPGNNNLPDRLAIERKLVEKTLKPILEDIKDERIQEAETIRKHIEVSLTTILNRENMIMADLLGQKELGSEVAGLDGRISISENKIDELNNRLENRRQELSQMGQCSMGDIRHMGQAWVLPHPDQSNPDYQPMRRDDEIERIAIEVSTKHDELNGYIVESVESENKGFDLIARKPHPEDPQTAIDVKFIEVKGRSAIGDVALTANEYKTATRLKEDYFLYVVYNCATDPQLQIIRNPAEIGWKPIVKVEHYIAKPGAILEASQH